MEDGEDFFCVFEILLKSDRGGSGACVEPVQQLFDLVFSNNLSFKLLQFKSPLHLVS
jgi:hypothetical protein